MVERWLLALCCALLYGGSVTAADNAGVQITLLDSSAASGALRLHWSQPVNTRIDSKLDERLLTFSRPLGEPDFSRVTERLAAFVRDLRFGYDTVLLILAPGVRAEIERESQGVTVRFSHLAPDMSSSAAPPPSDGDWRLDYLHAVALLESGDAQSAQRQLRRLARVYPEEPQILTALARATEQLGDWSGAFSLYGTAASLSAGSHAAAEARDRLWLAHGDQVRAELGHRSTDGADDQDILRVTGRALLSARTRVFTALEHRALQAPGVQRANGVTQSIDVSRTRGEFGVEQWRGPHRGQLSLLLGPDSAGLGLRLATGPQTRQGWLEASVNEPYWEYVEGLADGATRDRLAAGVRGEVAQVWQGAFSVNAHRYAMEDVGEVAESVGIAASLGYAVHRNTVTWLAIYRLDAEYFSDVAQRTAADERRFEPLPATSREVHAFGVEFGRSETSPIHYNLGAGYSIDRKGPDAPYLALQLDYVPTAQVLVGLRASYSLAIDSREDNPVTYIGAVGEYRFGKREVTRASRPAAAARKSPTVLQTR